MARLVVTSEPILVLVFFITFTLLSFTSAGPTGQRSIPKCVSFCGEGKNFQYAPGTTYIYEYATDIETTAIENSQQGSHIRVTAKAEVEAITSCDLKLQLKDVQFEDLTTPRSQVEEHENWFKDQKSELEQNPMLFGFQDGKIAEICANQNDDIWVLNVKRGIISMLQNSMDDLNTPGLTQETDINGRCPTEYILDGDSWGGGRSYRKIKDLTKCPSRQTQLSAVQSVPYLSSSPIQNIPLLQGKLECTQVVRNKRIEKVLCQEEQKFRPFDKRNSGAITTIVQTLDFTFEHKTQRNSNNEGNALYTKKTLLFESFEESTEDENGIDNSKDILQLIEYLESASFPKVTPNAPQLFVDLVERLRDSSEACLKTVYDSVLGSAKEKYLMEALPLIGSASSLAFLRDLTMKGALPEELAHNWLSSLAFIKHPTMKMVKAVAPILLESDSSMEAILGISAFINSYCKHHQSCNQEVVVNEILEKMTSYLGTSCQVDATRVQDVRQMVLRLKAIGNAGVLPITEEVSKTPVVMKCFLDRANAPEIRLAAIDSLRRLSCSSYENEMITQLFTNVEENTEIRIKAFLTIMKCANRQTIELVKSILYTESVNQVASFVWTYLTNLQETNRPEKQEIRDLISNEFLQNKFSTDVRKFSRNYEASTYSEDWNVGGGLDSNIIFTEESFLPKSGMVNLTVQLFGESVNLLEFGVRTHGLEQVLERIFGPQGYFPDNRVTEFLDSTRVKRDLGSQQETDGLGYLYDQAKPVVEQLPGGSFYTRIFGHEVLYKNFDISDKTPIPSVVDDSGKSWFNIRNILNNLSTGKSSEFSRSMILLDTSYSVATSSGFPLSLGVHAAATMSMVAKGKLSVGRLMEAKELDIEGTLKPSTMINVDGTLGIRIGRGGSQLRTGLKLHNTLRSSTAVEMKLLMKGKNLLHASVNFPQDKHEIIDVSSQLYIVGPKSQSPVDDQDQEDSSELIHLPDGCSSDYASEIFGMKICLEMNIPNRISFTPKRPSFLRVYMEKVDGFNGYTLNYQFSSDPSTTKLNVVFDTPDSIINRRVSADFLLDRGMGKIAASLESISTALRAEAVYTQFQKNFELSLATNERTNFLISTGLRSDGNLVKPHFLITWHSRPLMDLKGTIDLTPQANNEEKILIEMNLKHLTETPVKIIGEVTGSGEMKDASLSIESYIVTGTVRSQFKRKAGLFSTKTSVDYSWKRGKVHTGDLSAKLQRSKKGTLSKYLATAAFTTSQFPDYTVDFLWETQASSGFCENSLKMGWGKTTWEGHTLYSRQYQFDLSELRLEASLVSDKFDVDYKLEFAHQSTSAGFKTRFLGRLGTGNEFNANTEYISAVDDLLKKSLDAGATWPNSEYSIKALFYEKQRGDFEAELVVNLNNTKDMKATALYLNRSNNLKLDHTIEFRARGFTSVPFSGAIGLSATEKQTHIGCQLQFEGKKPYSSRMSTSLDYSHTKYSHKLEGKVTFNERKYNGELFYGTNKVGAKNITLDLQLEKHIFVEATLSGMLPNPMVASLLVVPDKDNQPNNNVKLDGNVDPNSLSLGVHYFGEEFGFAGRYNDVSVLLEAVWPEDKKLMVSVVLPKFSIAEAQLELDILTPFQGYNNITFVTEHVFDGEKLKTTATGGVEESLADFTLSGTFSSREISMSTNLIATDYPDYQGSILILRRSKRKSFQISLKSGKKTSLLDFDFVNLDEGYMGKFQLSGCPFFNKISMEVNHQYSASTASSYHTKIEWAENLSVSSQQLSLLVKTQLAPFSIEGTFSSPWNPVKHVTASLTWDPDTANRQLIVTTEQAPGIINSNFKLVVSGNVRDFRHEMDGEWYGKTMRLTMSGGFDGFSDSNFHSVLRLPANHFSFDFLSKKENRKYIGEFRADLDSSVTTAGIKWDLSSEITSHKAASIWGQMPNHPPVSAAIKYETSGSSNTINLKVNRKDKSVIDMESQLQSTGMRLWDANFVLKSEFEVIPSISLRSKHNVADMNKISHVTTFELFPKNEETFWPNRFGITARRLSLDLAIDNLEDIKGTAIIGEADFVFEGKVEKLNGEYRTNMKVSSNQFHEVNFQGTFSKHGGSLSSTGRLSKRNGENIVNFQVDTKIAEKETFGKFSLESSFTPKIDGFVGFTTVDKLNFTMYLTRANDNLLNFNSYGSITTSVGSGHALLSSGYFTSISHLQLDLDYDVAATGVNCNVAFQDGRKIHSVKLESDWNGDQRVAKLEYASSISFLVEASLEGLSQVAALATYNGEKLGEISIAYRPEQGDFSFGKHGVYMTFTDSTEKMQNYNVILGLDSKKIFLNVQTPFENWSDVVIDGQVTPSATVKGLKFLLQREAESISGSFEAKTSRKAGTLQLNSELSVSGFSKLRQMLLETAQATDIQGLSAIHPQHFTFQLIWASSSINLNVETPVNFLRKLALAGSWELKKVQKFIAATADINANSYKVKADFQNEGDKFAGKLSLAADDTYKLEVDYDFTNEYKAKFILEEPSNWNIGGKISIKQDMLEFDVTTPIKNYESLSVTLLREFPTAKEGLYSIAWNKNGNADKVELKYEFDQGRIEFRATTPIQPWNSVVVTIIYDTPFRRLTFHSQRGDGQEIKMNFEIESSGNMTTFQSPASSSILVAIESPMEHFQDIKFSLLYDRKDLIHVANLSIVRNGGETEGKLNLKFQHSDPVALDISAHLVSPLLTSKAAAHASLLVDPNGESTISAHVQANGKRYEMNGLSQLTTTVTKFEMRTSLPFLRQLKFSLKKSASISLYGIWTGNGKQVEVHGDVLCTGLRSSKISFNVSTPVDLMGSFGFDGEIRSEGGNTNAKLVFQNHEVRWSAKLNRQQDDAGKDDWRLQVNTPLVGYKHVVISLKHVLTSLERNVITTVQLNKKEMSMKIAHKSNQLNMVLSSELSHLPVQATIDSDWSRDIILKIATNAGNYDYGTTFNLDLQGISNGNLEFAMSAMNNFDTTLDWKFDGDLREGQGLVNVQNSFIGSKSLRSSWKNEDWRELQCDVWVRTGNEENPEKGVTIQYEVTPHAHYGSIKAMARYILEDGSKSITFEGSLDETSSQISFDSVLKTPFEDFQTFEAKGHLMMKNDIVFNIAANVNDEKLIEGNLNLSVVPLKSRLFLVLDVPLITDPLELDAAYDIGTENKAITILFKQNVYMIDVQLSVTVPRNSHLVDITLKAESTVPNLFIDISGKVNMEYAVSEDGTRRISFNLKGTEVGEWKLLAEIKATSDLHSKVIFEGPFYMMPSLMAEVDFRGNAREGVQSELTVILEGSELTANMRLDRTRWETGFKYFVGSFHYTGDGKLTFSSGETNLDIRYKAEEDYNLHIVGNLKITRDTKQGSGSITISSGSESEVPLSFDIVMENHANIRAVGSCHDKQVKVEAHLKGVNGGSWLTEGNTMLKMEGNVFGKGNLDFMLTAQHFFRDGRYSVNATTGEDGVTFESYIGMGQRGALLAKLKWFSSEEAILDVKLLPSNVIVLLRIPNWLDINLSGDYGSSENSAFINGVLLFNGHTSHITSSVSKEGNRSVCRATLDIPSIKQKLDVELASITLGPQNMKGTVDLKVNEQKFQISGGLKSQVFESTTGERYIERILQISSNVTALELTTIGLELFLRKPLKSYSSVSIIGTLSINDQVSVLSGGYEIPNPDSSNTGLYLKLQSSYFPTEENYEFFLKAFGNRMRKVEGKLNYKMTRFDILWDLIMPTSVISFSYSGVSEEDGERIFLQVESVLNPSENIQLNINCHGWDTHYKFRTSLTRSAGTVIGHLFMDAPKLLASTNEYKITVLANEDKSYTMEASAVRGRLIMELVGDAALTPHSLNVVLKAMGSYGSHYVMIVGGKEDQGEYGFEMTAESSTLLVGKRVNIRGNVTLDERSITTVIQCRARRNVHELNMFWRKDDGGKSLLSLTTESPSADPIKLEVEWTSQEKNYQGKVLIQGFQSLHQSEFALNLKSFEGKLHIISPLLPSNEFHFHLKSVVNSRNIDILGDIRIRGSHWRLEGVAIFADIQDMTFKLEMRTPFQFLDRVTFGIKSAKEEVYLEVHTPASYIPNVLFKLGGMQGLEQGLWYGLKPNIVISVPDGKYSAMASLEIPKSDTPGILHTLLQYNGNESHTMETYLELSPLNNFKLQMDDPCHLELKIVTPFEFLSQAKFYIEGEINSKRSGKVQVTGRLNTHEGKFDGSFDNSVGNMQAVTKLVTNIPGYEQSAFAFAIQTFHGIGNGKSFHVQFRKPDWEKQFRLDADYRYKFESFMELEGEVNVNMDSYMNVPPLHSNVKSGMKDGRYSGVIEGEFGLHKPALKVETESIEGQMTVFVEGKAGVQDRYNFVNTFQMIPSQNDFFIREKLHWNGSEVLNTEINLSDEDEILEGHLHLFTPWGPVTSKVVLSPITFLTMNEALSLSQLVKNSNLTVDVHFNETRLVGLEIVSKDGMRLFEVHNPIRPVALSIAVEKVDWSSLRMKAGVCWNLNIPEKSSIGFDAHMYKRSTGLTLGGYIAGASYGIGTLKFEHFFISSRLAQNLVIRWNGFAGRSGQMGYNLNVTDKSTRFKRQVDYELKVVAPSRTVLISGGNSGDDKYSINNMAVSWDAFRDPEKSLKFNLTSLKSSTWRTISISNSLQIQHVFWEEPVAIAIERIFVHDLISQFQVVVQPSSNPASHFTLASSWDGGDWSNFAGSVLQPSSNIDMDVKYNVSEQSKSLMLKYTLFTGESKIFSASHDKTLSSHQVLVQHGDSLTPTTMCSIASHSTPGEHSLKANLYSYQVAGYIQRSLPYLDLTLRHANTHRAQLLLGLPHPREIVLKTTRSHFTQTVNDVNFLIRLNSSNLLSTRIHWRPELMDEIVEYDWLKGSKHFMHHVLPSFPELSNAVRTEVEGHWNLFSSPVKNFLVAFYQFSAVEINQIVNEVKDVGRHLQRMYANNAFYMKDAVDAVYASLVPLTRLLKNVYATLKETCSTICYYLVNAGKLLSNTLLKYYGGLETHVMKAWDNLEGLLVNFWTKNAAWIQEMSEELEECIDALIEAFEGRIEMLESKLMAVGFIRKLIQFYQEYAAWIEELPLDDYMTAIEDFFQIKVWDKLEELLGPYMETIRNALNTDYLKDLLETPPIPYIRFVLRQTKNAIVRLWDLVEIEGKFKDLVRQALRSVDGLMQRNFPSWELEWDLDSGVIEYDQSLSIIEWTDFTQYPRWHLESQETQEVNQITNFYYQVMDYIEHLKPIFDMRIRDILPPFGGFAMMAGDHHYYTFDKKYFRFAGECSYVLVADLLHNGFSFIVNYDSDRDGDIRKKSYTIALANHNIEFDVSNFKVTVDNRKVELPAKIDTVYIRRQETRLDIYDIRGYQITCSLSPSVCTFSTSGWYYGKLAGLLGTYDNEPKNDYKSADGEVISDIPSFTYSWRVGRDRNQCRMKNFAKDEEESVDVDNICYDLLGNRNSPLRPCFNTVDTRIFMEMCKYDISRNVNSASRTDSACTSMQAYVTECQKNNIDVWMPPTCVRCKLEDGRALTTGENVTLQTNGLQRPPSSSDIVLLVEEQDCIDQLDISSAVTKLEAALRAEGITDNRYAYVGFGGQGIHHDAHIQTSSSNVWSHSTLFRIPDKMNATGVKRSDLYSAIHFASTMTFRAGVSKTLIAITCGSDKCGDSVRYSDTLTLLVENDFMLHMVTSTPFTWKGEKKQDDTLQVFGFDVNGVYTSHHAKRGPLVADPSFKRQLNLPKDLCTPLAVETNGTRFTTDNLSKKTLDVWSRRVAQTAHPSECQRCECVPDKNGGSRFMCHQCVSPTMWKFLEEWKSYQSQEVDDMFGVEGIMEAEPFLLPPH